MPWIRNVGPVDRVHVPFLELGYGHPDGGKGWPRMTPVEVTDEQAEHLDGHPEWEPCDAPAESPAGESVEG